MDRRKAFRRFPELRTERLVLRKPTMRDAPWYLEHFSRPEVVWGEGYPAPRNLTAARSELRRYMVDLYRERLGFRWIITRKGDGRAIGSLGFYKWSPSAAHQAEIGYDLDREHWGQGIMTEAMTAVIDFGFERMRLSRIEVLIMPRNTRSTRLVRRLGFQREGLLRRRGFDEVGSPCDEVLFSLLASDWRRRTPTLSRARVPRPAGAPGGAAV